MEEIVGAEGGGPTTTTAGVAEESDLSLTSAPSGLSEEGQDEEETGDSNPSPSTSQFCLDPNPSVDDNEMINQTMMADFLTVRNFDTFTGEVMASVPDIHQLVKNVVRDIQRLMESDSEDDTQLDFLQEVFQNPLTGEKVAEFLTLSDMKAVSEVSTGLSHSVRNTKRFSDMAMLRICRETVLKDIVVNSTKSWKRVEIDVSLPFDVADKIVHILKTVRTLRFVIQPMEMDMDTDGNKKLDVKELAKFLIFILTNSPHLATLQLESVVMEMKLHDIFSDLAVQPQLSRLKSLEIFSQPYIYHSALYTANGGEIEMPFQTNFHQLSMISHSLETFKMPIRSYETLTIDFNPGAEMMPPMPGMLVFGRGTKSVNFIPNLVSSNKHTLTELSLHLDIWSLEDMKMISCPNLKRLTITAYARDSAVVAAFLNNQPSLEELVVNMRDGFPLSVISAIKGRCSKLTKLHLKGKSINELPLNGEMDWSFLKGINTLRDFSISKPLCNSGPYQGMYQYGNGIKFLRLLPNELQKLRLQGLGNFWCELTGNPWNHAPVPNPERFAVMHLYKNVTELSFIGCDNAFDNNILQYVFKEFDKLRTLELSHCYNLTDFGLTGIPNANEVENDGAEETGISLKNLKGLSEFKLNSCVDVSSAAVQEVVALPNLRSFEYYSFMKLDREFAISIAKQNPNLESLSLRVSTTDFLQIKKDLRNANPRLLHFYNLDQRSICIHDDDEICEEQPDHGFEYNYDDIDYSDSDTDTSDYDYGNGTGDNSERDSDGNEE